MKQVGRALQEKWIHRDRGAILVELAMVLPLLFLILLATVEFGFAFREHQILQNAVREAARFSANPGNQVSPVNPNATLAAVQEYVIDYCNNAHISSPVNPDEISIDQNYPISYTADDGVTGVRGSMVSISHTHALIFGGAMLPVGGQIVLTASVVFRNMY